MHLEAVWELPIWGLGTKLGSSAKALSQLSILGFRFVYLFVCFKAVFAYVFLAFLEIGG